MSDAQAIQTLLGASAVAVLLLVQSYIARRFARDKHAETVEKLETVERTVNGTHAKLNARVEQLAQALQAAGVAIPPTPTTEDA
jgi:hypothetical protein